MKYEYLEHTADMKFKSYGKTLEDAFQNAVLAVSNFLSREKPVKSDLIEKTTLEGEDNESLLYELLDHTIFLLDSKSFLVASVSIKISKKENKLIAEVIFKGDDASKYDINQIKAATYAEMKIKKTSEGYEVQAVMDV